MAGGNAVLLRIGATADGFLGVMNKVVGKIKDVGKTMSFGAKVAGAFGTAIAIVGAVHVRNSIKEFIKFEQQLAGLAKVMDDFDAARSVARSIGEMSTVMPVASERMFEVAETAARLGIRGTRNITEFTRVASMMGVATDLSADVAADAFARILKQTNTPIRQFETLASVVNELSNTMATTTSEIVDSMRRAAPELARVGLQAPEMAAFAASLNEVSESATRAGTRLRRLAQDLGDPRKIDAFAKSIGETPGAFRDLLREDPVGTIQRIIKVFGEGGAAAEELATKIDSRVRLALAALSQNIAGTNRALENMKRQIAGPDSLQKEFDIFASTTQSAMQKTQNAIDELQRRTGEKVIIMRKAWESLKFAIVDAMIAARDALEDFDFTPERAEEFRRAIEREFAGGVQLPDIEVLGKTRDIDISTTFKENAEGLSKVLVDTVVASLRDMEDGAAEAAELLEQVLIPAMQSAGDAAEKLDMGLSINQLITGFFGDVASIAGDAPPIVQDAANFALETFREKVLKAAEDGFTADELLALIGFTNESLAIMRAQKERAVDRKSQVAFDEDAEKLLDRLKMERLEIEKGELAAFEARDVFINASKDKQAELRKEFLLTRAAREAEEERQRVLREIESASERNRDLQERLALVRLVDEEERERLKNKQEIARLDEEIAELVAENADAELIAAKKRERRLTFAIQMYEELTEKEREQRDAARKAAEAEQKRLKDMQDRIDEMRLLTAEARFDFLTRSLERMADAAVDAFGAIISGSENAGEAVLKMINDIANEILRRQLTAFLFGLINSGTSAASGGGGGGGGTKFDAFGHPVQGFASGGRIEANQLAIVGEKGPEMFVPRVSGTIVPNDKLDSVSGDNYTVNANFTVNAMDGADAKRVLAQNREFITGMVTESVSRSRQLKKRGL